MQRKHIWTNVRLVLIPLFLCLILLSFQLLLDAVTKSFSETTKCGNKDDLLSSDCAIPNPPLLPPMLEIPEPVSRAVKANLFPYNGLPDKSCRKIGTCPVTILVTGNNHSLGKGTCLIMLPPCYVHYTLIFDCCGTYHLHGSCFFSVIREYVWWFFFCE